MKTDILKIDENGEIIEKCAYILKMGGLVAFPTETVYGLGANGLDKDSVKKIYEAKGRPSDNPLILHISDICELDFIIENASEKGQILASKFWPGPLTLVFEKSNIVPMEVSGGLNTIAIRIPKNTIARELIAAAGVPIAAPSANISGSPSPTSADHVIFDLDGKIDAIIDGGNCEFGLESTIIDVSVDPPMLLRPGAITLEMIENAIGKIDIDETISNSKQVEYGKKPKAPGMKYKHYSPKAKITIFSGDYEKIPIEINKSLNQNNNKVGVLTVDQHLKYYDNEKYYVISLGSFENMKQIGSNLFSAFRKFDDFKVDEIFSEGFSNCDETMAVMNRLQKAAGYNIIFV